MPTAIECRRAPIIIMGAPRSGTTLLANCLARLGLFIGHSHVEDSEAAYFFRANREVVKRVHGYWDHPAAIRYFLEQPVAVEETAQCLSADVRSRRIAAYLGWRRLARWRSIEAFDEPWGWKDPTNVLTLPLWLKVFPTARVVHIVRHGVDVARSLQQMEARVIAQRREKAKGLMARLRYRSSLERLGFKGAVRCATLGGAFSLWEEYAALADEAMAQMTGQKRVIRYEDLLAQPREELTALADFCGLPAPLPSVLSELVTAMRGDRAGAFARDAELLTFYEKVKDSPWMQRFGYSMQAAHG